MKIEKISINKIKMTVTNEDMNRLGISVESFVTDSPERRELFRTLIKRAEDETGINIDNSRVMVEAMPLKYDGLVVFFTKLDADIEISGLTGFKARLRAKPKKETGDNIIFAFDDIDTLCEYAMLVSHTDVDGDLYFYNEKYYLVLSPSGNMDLNLTEYSARDDEITEVFLAEHGKLIVKENALHTIEKYFNMGG